MWGDFYLTRSLATCIYFGVIKIIVKVNSYNQNKMKPVSSVEVYTTKFCHSLSIEKILQWVNNLCLKLLYFGFILLLRFSIFIIMNIHWSKQPHYTWSCLWNMHSVVCFCYFWKDKPLLALKLFISEYLDQIPPWKEMKEAFSVKLQSENLCFCLR